MSRNDLITCDDEIIKIIEKIFLAGSHLELVQKDGNQLISNNVHIINVNLNSLDIAFRSSDPAKLIHFNYNRPIQVKSFNGNIIFKTSFRCERMWSKLGFMNIPKLITIKNMRSNERINLEKFELPINFKNFTLFDYSNGHNNIISEIIDLSESGLALKMAKNHAEKFSTNDKIIFTLINGYSFSNKATGRLIYVNKVKSFETKEDDYFKMGIKFDSSNPYDQIAKFIDNQFYIQS
jgi:hypothetical protein